MLARRIARPLLAGIFVSDGFAQLRDPKPFLRTADPGAAQTVPALPIPLPSDPAQLVRIDGAVKLGAGSMLALGRLPRLAAVALIGSLVPTTLAAHRFWAEPSPVRRNEQQVQFLKNLGLLGGLLLAAVDTEGRPSLGWRARRAARSAKDSVADVLPIG